MSRRHAVMNFAQVCAPVIINFARLKVFFFFFFVKIKGIRIFAHTNRDYDNAAVIDQSKGSRLKENRTACCIVQPISLIAPIAI